MSNKNNIDKMFIVRHSIRDTIIKNQIKNEEYMEGLRKQFQSTEITYIEPIDKPLYKKHYLQMVGRTQRSSVELRLFEGFSSINQITLPNQEEVDWAKEGF